MMTMPSTTRWADSPPLEPTPGTDSGWESATRLLLASLVILAGYDIRPVAGASLALVVVVGSIPMWWDEVSRFIGARAVISAALVAVVAGVYLARQTAATHVLDPAVLRFEVAHLLSGVATMVALLWARTRFPLHVVCVLFGSGALANVLLNEPLSWKFTLGVPVTTIVVGYLGRLENPLPAIAALLVSGVLALVDTGRSLFAFCVLGACLVVWQARPGSSRSGRWTPALALAAAATLVYVVSTWLLTAGHLGRAAQERSIAQIEATGSLLAGGRPEWAASRALFAERPWGYGVGIVPDVTDYGIAKSGFDAIGVDPGGYLTNYMLGGRFRLHSVTADLWVSYGIAGLVLAAIVIALLLTSVTSLLAQRKCPPIAAFLAMLALFYMAFGPIFSNWPDVCLALGVLLVVRDPDRSWSTALDQGA